MASYVIIGISFCLLSKIRHENHETHPIPCVWQRVTM
jgi:hypothetical protein